MVDLTADEAAYFGGDTPRPCLFLYIESSPAVRAWSGARRFNIEADAIDTSGVGYLPMGLLQGGVPAIQALMNGQAERIDLTVSGFDPTLMDLADAHSADIIYCTAHIGCMALDSSLQPATPMVWYRDATIDAMPMRFGDPCTLGLSFGSTFIDRRKRVALGYYSGPDQRRRSSDDAFCDLAMRYNAGTTEKWPV